jgi:matrixin
MVSLHSSLPRRVFGTVAALLLCSTWLQASSLAPTSELEDVKAALGICTGRITGLESFRHPQRGGIFTRVKVSVIEAIKGDFPASFTLIQRGGTIDGESESTGLASSFAVGDERLFYVAKRADGSLELLRGFAGAENIGAAPPRRGFASLQKLRRVRQLAAATSTTQSTPVTGADFGSQTGVQQANSGTPSNALGLLVDGYNIPARLLAPDRGEAVGYLVDVQALPSGITQEQALTAVTQALAAWSAVTGVTFRFDGLQSFGQSAAAVGIDDERLRIQLHDLFGEISGGTTLGVGGRVTTNVSNDFTTTGGGGGQVNGQEFHQTTRGYVVLKHTASSMQTLSTFAEVLCHEVGHALGMAHSSENAAETDATLKQAVMYFQAHSDGRGAVLGSYDGPVIQKAHPPTDTPPYSYDRIMPLVTAPSAITTVAGINEMQLFGCDLQTASAALTLVTTGPLSGSAGTLSFTGNTVKVAQAGYFSDGSVDPSTTSFYVLKWVRFSDGVNASPWSRVRITSIYADSQADGLPDSWMITYFGSIVPSSFSLSRASDDKDGDGLSNLTEFRLGTSPIDASSRLKTLSFATGSLQWSTTPYLLYYIESSPDLATWTRFGNPILPTTTTGQSNGSFIPAATARKFYRVQFAP